MQESNTAERQKLLQQKLTANRQKIDRQRYLNDLPEPLRNYLATCEFIYPEWETFHKNYLLPFQSDDEDSALPEGYSYHKLLEPEQVLEVVEGLSTKHHLKAAFFYPSDSESPCMMFYCVEFGWVIENFKVLYEYKRSVSIDNYGRTPYSHRSLQLVTTDFAAGLLVSHHVGDDFAPHYDDVVYTVRTWDI